MNAFPTNLLPNDDCPNTTFQNIHSQAESSSLDRIIKISFSNFLQLLKLNDKRADVRNDINHQSEGSFDCCRSTLLFSHVVV